MSPGRLLSNRQMWILTAAPRLRLLPPESLERSRRAQITTFIENTSAEIVLLVETAALCLYILVQMFLFESRFVVNPPHPPPKKSVTTFINIYFYLLTEFVLVRFSLTRFSPDVSSDRRPILSPNLLKFTHLFCGNSCFLFVSN